MTERLELGPDVEAVLRNEEAAALHELHSRGRVRCLACGSWIEPWDEATVTLSLDGTHSVPVTGDDPTEVQEALAWVKGI